MLVYMFQNLRNCFNASIIGAMTLSMASVFTPATAHAKGSSCDARCVEEIETGLRVLYEIARAYHNHQIAQCERDWNSGREAIEACKHKANVRFFKIMGYGSGGIVVAAVGASIMRNWRNRKDYTIPSRNPPITRITTPPEPPLKGIASASTRAGSGGRPKI